MRDLAMNEVNEISGGYYFYEAVDGAVAGTVIGATAWFFATLVNPVAAAAMPLATTVGYCAGVGATAEVATAMALDLDIYLLRSYYGFA